MLPYTEMPYTEVPYTEVPYTKVPYTKLPYSKIAASLEEIASAPRGRKSDLAAGLLKSLNLEDICPVVRLFSGDLWPSWEPLEMGIGPESVMSALEEISEENISSLRRDLGDMGAVAQSALQHKSQHSLSLDPLDALEVYHRLRHIPRLFGPESEHRKAAILRGLLLEASPLEGKYIVRTVTRNMLTGLGPQTMIAAISLAFGLDSRAVLGAYNLMPDLGMLASVAGQGKIGSAKIEPSRPIKPMLFKTGEGLLPAACLPLYPGLRVQVHKTQDRTCIYTHRLKNITAALTGLAQEIRDLKQEIILDAMLMGFQEGVAIASAEVVRYINRRHFARRSSITPALIAYDLIYLNGRDLTCQTYDERRRKLLEVLGAPKELPFKGISPAKGSVLDEPKDVERNYRSALQARCKGLMVRDLKSCYLPGMYSSCDAILRKVKTITAAVVGAKFGTGKREGVLVKYKVAMRNGDDLSPVGWVSAGLGKEEAKYLSDHLQSLIISLSQEGIDVRPQVGLALRIAGASRDGEGGYSLTQPKIEEVWFDISPEEVDSLERLEEVYAGRDS